MAYCPLHGSEMEITEGVIGHFTYKCPEGCLWQEDEDYEALFDVTSRAIDA